MRPLLYARLFHHLDTSPPDGWARAGTRPAPPDPDRRGSRRLLLAAVLLRRGESLEHVAAVTGVPVALLELLALELGSHPDLRP